MKKLILLPGGIFAVALIAFLLLPLGTQPPKSAGIEGIAAAQSARVPADAPSFKLIAQSDLPPTGTRSLFDHLIRENGSLPFPFDRMLDVLTAYDGEARAPQRLLIPDGRSLLKGHASFARPRMVVAVDAEPPAAASIGPLFKGRLFLGFVEDAQEIEVISYNEAAGRFEFQLVENYCAGCVPRIVYAKRAICMTCHTGGAPIFPVRPWEETNVQPSIYSRIEQQRAVETSESTSGSEAAADYFGAPLRRKLDDGQAFDNLTDIANVIPTTQRIWIDGCGVDGADCRRHLLKLALRYATNPSALDNASDEQNRLLELQERNWPQAGIALANGNLNNRNPLEQDLYDESFGAQLKRLLLPKKELVRPSGDKLKDFDSLPSLPAEFDPLTPRPAKKLIQASDLDGVYGVAQMFAAGDIARLDELSGYDPERLDQAVDKLDTQYFSAQPVRRIELLNALYSAMGASERGYCCLDVSEMSEPIAQGEPPLTLADDSVLQPFEHYCFACHRGNPAARLDFMSGPDEASVLAKIKAKDEIRDVLDYERYLDSRKAGQLMPPEDSWQREALDKALEAGEDPLTVMRDQIPSLFDF